MNKEFVYKLFLNMCDVGQQKITIKDKVFKIEHQFQGITSYYTVFSNGSSFIDYSIDNAEENVDVFFSIFANNDNGTYDTINRVFNCHGNVFAVQRRFKALQEINYIFYGV
jgi:hypothetical protein